MVINCIKKHGTGNFSYTGEIDKSKVNVVFENGAKPVEGNIKVEFGKIIIKGELVYCYIKSYKEVVA